MSVIFHVTTREAWQTALENGAYETASLASEGFIHCSQEEQISGVLERYFSNQHDLIKLHIDTAKLLSQLIYEWSPSVSQTFPHVYGPINIDSVIKVEPIK